jgi:hypothetical protein
MVWYGQDAEQRGSVKQAGEYGVRALRPALSAYGESPGSGDDLSPN